MENKENIEGFDPAKYWPDAEKMLDSHFRAKRTRKRAVLILFFGLIASLSTWMIFEFTGKNEIEKRGVSELSTGIPEVKKPSAVIEKIPVTPSVKKNVQNSVPARTSKSIPNAPSKVDSKSSAPNIVPVSPQPIDRNNSLTNNSGSAESKPPKKNSVGTKHPVIKPELTVNASVNPIVEKQSNPETKEQTPNPETNASAKANSKENNTQATNTNPESVNPEVKESSPGNNTSAAEPEVAIAPELKTKQENTESNIVRSEELINPLALNKASIVSTPGIKQELISVAGIPFPLPGYTGPKLFSWSYELYGGAQLVNKNLTANVHDDYLLRRQQDESAITTPLLGTSIRAAIKNFSFNIGIEYSSWGEKTNYAPYVHQQQFVQNGYWQSFLTTFVDTDTAYVTGIQVLMENSYQRVDSNFETATDTVDAKVYSEEIARLNGTNRFSYVEVPLEFSYRLHFGKAGIGASVGIAPSWISSQKGYYLKQDESGMESIAETKPLNSFGWNGRCSIDFYYALSNRMSLMLRPQYRTNLRSLTADKTKPAQRYNATAVNFGISYLIR